MPRMTSTAIITGGTSEHLNVKADTKFEATMTGGNTKLTLQGGAKMEAKQDVDRYHYKNFSVKPQARYEVQVFDKDGRLKWSEDFHNLVTTAGLNKIVDATFKAGLASPAWFIGLIDGDGEAPSFAPGDIISAHSGWVESVAYGEEKRQAYVPGTIGDGAVDNSASRALFTMTGAHKIAGAFFTDDDTKGGVTDGVLYGAGAFSGGIRDVEEGDTLRVTVTQSMTESD